MRAEIITIGDEILIGQIVDTNSQWMATELNKIGVSVHQITSIQDDRAHILAALQEAQGRADLVLITGGLGPTKDDITKKTLAEFFNDDTYVFYDVVYENIARLFKKINHPMNEVQRYQAEIPSKATVLRNRFGTAPGMWFYENDTVFISMPGVPYEMKGIVEYEVIPRIQEQFNLPYIIHKTIITYGQGESVIAERIEMIESNLPKHIKLAYLPSFGKVRLRLTAKGADENQLIKEVAQQQGLISETLSDIIVGYDDGATIEKFVGNLLAERGLTVATAESLTGGKIASTLVAVPGASNYFKGSVVAYTAEAKQELLKVSENTIEEYSVVSSQVAMEMAQGAFQQFKTDFAIAVTGNAGPSTDKTDKTVGTVFIAIVSKNGIDCQEFNFGQPRSKVILRTVHKSLEMLQKEILKNT